MKNQKTSVGLRLISLALAQTAALTATLGLLGGCGQKGPLTLPAAAEAASAPVKR
jgi:predicted small lipoprotein YifL